MISRGYLENSRMQKDHLKKYKNDRLADSTNTDKFKNNRRWEKAKTAFNHMPKY